MTDERYTQWAEHYRRQGAPPDALDKAVATFADRHADTHGGMRQRWPMAAATVAVLCAVLLIPVYDQLAPPERGGSAQPRLGQLSLRQLDLPTQPAHVFSATAGTELASVTRLPVRIPKLNRLRVAGEQAKETL